MTMYENWITLSEIENMLPYEREVYLTLLNEHLKEENRKQREANRRGR
tara:strand:- start:71 stop:214 length:144 start_codon:yes stop_codon:yes gene_type:complete